MSHIAEHRHDPQSFQTGYLFGNDYAKPYKSNWSAIHDVDRDLLMHMNCSYLSTHGQPPTLLALKQHAQSLAQLISRLCPTTAAVEFGGVRRSDAAAQADAHGAFDWLADLSRPYWNDDPGHHKPLNALLNEVRSAHDVLGAEYHCPLAEAPRPRRPAQAARPYAAHHLLLMHANECLERLDHEFAATGGLLSMLPVEGDGHSTREAQAARNSLVGQWLQFTGHLVGRMHELEIAYANCLDALASEAVVPLQHAARLGPDGRSAGREVAYPQDRWVLANAGDDVFGHLHDLFDRDEALIEEKEALYRGRGAASERLWAERRGGGEYARGIVPVNVNTRYYRLRGQGRGTIFVLPAWDHHPGVEHTRRAERRPTVVSVVQPKFPLRASDLERRYDERLERAGDAELENLKLRQATMRKEEGLHVLQDELERERAVGAALSAALGRDAAQVAAELGAARERAAALEARAAELQAKVEAGERSAGEELTRKVRLLDERDRLVGQIRQLGLVVTDDFRIQQPAP